MTKTYIARDTTLSNSFETNFPSTEGGTFITGFPRQMLETTGTEVETTLTFPNSTTRKIAYYVEIGKTDWSDDRVGDADWSTIFRTGATGDTNIELDTVTLQRVSNDGNTSRATITVVSGATDQMGADTNIQNDVTNNTTLDNPGGAASDDMLVIVFTMDNTSAHGGDDSTSVEQNLSGSTRVVAPIFDAASPEIITPLIINGDAMI